VIPQAVGEVLVFVDDDNVLAADYLEQALRVGDRHAFIGAWGGSCLPEFEVPPPAWIGDLVARLTAFEVKADVWGNQRDNFAAMPVGAGLCMRREAAQLYLQHHHASPLASKLDRIGKGLGGYGDFNMVLCALDLGMGAGQFACLSLTHLISADRLTLDYFVRQAEGDAITLALFRASRGLKLPPPLKFSWFARMHWLLHRLKHRIPRERVKIIEAERRGAQTGWDMVQKLEPKDLKQEG
jgi:hypothetical protein